MGQSQHRTQTMNGCRVRAFVFERGSRRFLGFAKIFAILGICPGVLGVGGPKSLCIVISELHALLSGLVVVKPRLLDVPLDADTKFKCTGQIEVTGTAHLVRRFLVPVESRMLVNW